MDIVLQFAAILLGVVISIVLPIVVTWVVLPNRAGGFSDYVKKEMMPYIKAGIAAIVISLIILVFAPELDNLKAAVMLGFGWQSFFKTLQPAA